MRLKKIHVLFGLSIAAFVFVTFLLGKSSNQANDEEDENLALEKKIKELERDLKRNHDIVQKIGKSVVQLLQKVAQSGESIPQSANNTVAKSWNKFDTKPEISDCFFAASQPLQPDIQMLDVYSELKFDNPDGGVWKQGWEVQYDPSQFSESKKLKVFVVPHSHNDPGWIKTFEKYYEDQTRHIFDNLVRKIGEDSRRKFIWAEISYLDLWWKSNSDSARKQFKDLVTSGQIEIVTGGWVMNDEANTHYYAMIEQLMAGHEWVQQKIGVIPQNGWAIDPFGYSASMAYLLKRSGLENMVIQRVHYAIKKAFAKKQTLEFRWRQIWDRDGLTDMFCHLMPFYSYDVPHTCGPDPKICCQFDFRRMKTSYKSGQTPIGCPWKISPVPITDENVDKKARMLLDQYRKKASLYKTNVLLVQLGDDFRYDTALEFDQQFVNYQKLFDYMNQNKDMFVEAKFGTLRDYFEALRSETRGSMEKFPSLSGDFFTYADIDDHYWSGYFTSRPFHKHVGRQMESYLRSAEIIYSMTWSHIHRLGGRPHTKWMTQMMSELVEARHNLGLFQHHDGITGTEKDHVVIDYAIRLTNSIKSCQRVIEQCSYYLLNAQQSNFEPDWQVTHLTLDESFTKYNELAEPILITWEGPRKRIIVYNPLGSERVELITLRIAHANVQVFNGEGEVIAAQLSPVFKSPHQVSSSEFDISFVVSVPPLGLATYFISKFDGLIQDNRNLDVARVMVRESRSLSGVEPFKIEVRETLEAFTLRNMYIEANFDSDGTLVSVTHLSTRKTNRVSVQFVRYGTRRGKKGQSGAYLFLPDGEGRQILMNPDDPSAHVRIIRGDLRSQVQIHLPFVVHRIALHNSPGNDGVGLLVDNLVNVVPESNIEIAMRIVSDVESGASFYSDLNGLQMTRRHRWEKLPLQAHFYPMPTMAYIEDDSNRITVTSKQPLGVASLSSGQLEVMLDRRLNQDDNRGVGQGVMDNISPTLNSFRILFEPKISSCKDLNKRPDGYPTLTAHKALHAMLYPLHRLIWHENQENEQVHLNFKPALGESGPDIHLVNLRTMVALNDDALPNPTERVALIIHRLGFDCCFQSDGLNSTTRSGEFSVQQLFPDYFGNQVKATSLTTLVEGPVIEKSFTVALKPMEVYTFELQP